MTLLDGSNQLLQQIWQQLNRFAILLFFGLIFLLYCLYSPMSFEITCNRDTQLNTECTVVPHSLLLVLASIKIEHPLAIDITQREPFLKTHYGARPIIRNRRGLIAVMRIRDQRKPLQLISMSSAKYEKIQSIADRINHFLLDPSVKNFHAELPEEGIFPLRFSWQSLIKSFH